MDKNKQSESSINIAQLQLKTVMDLTQDGILILSSKGFVLDANQQLNQWIGLKPKEIIGKHLLTLSFISNDQKKIIAKNFANRFLGKKIEPYQLELISKKGEIIISQVTAKVVTNPTNKEKIDVVVLSNLNKQSDMMKMASLAEKKYKNLFNQMNDGVAIYQVSDDGQVFTFLDINTAGEKLDNLKKEDLINKDVTKIFPGIEQMGLLDVFKKVWQTGESIKHPVSQYKDNKISFWRENFVYKIADNQIVTIYKDLSIEKHAQAEIEYNQAIQKSITESTDDSISLIDTKLKYIHANPKHLKRIGQKLDQVINKKYENFHNTETIKKIKEAVEQANQTKKSSTFEYLSNRDDKYYLVTVSPVINNDKIEAYSVIAKDINDQKSNELKIKNQLEDMEKLNQLMVGRELKMIELKNQIKILEKNAK